MGFVGRTAFITGAGNGIGKDMAKHIVANGGNVIIADVDEAAGRAAATEIGADRVLAVHCDVADQNSVESAVKAGAERFGGLDILVNNAGLHLTKWNVPITTLDEDAWKLILGVNVIGIVNCARAARPFLAEGKSPAIVSLSSITGYLSNTVYGITKLAVRGLTVGLASEFAPDGIRVNAIAPGAIASENALAELAENDVINQMINNYQLIHRGGTTTDIVQAMEFLCTDSASFITGQTLQVSGGFPLYI
ncbi:SDR family NAD(P)-dependent oxidoreductase [Glaciibacter superstes]|uniref:SDR family NAD(P)-dependent oxidoreductase n=1 Tax=Glaciibacter superstes TaxID=501023 RepID=UPI0003B7722C|nr:SDR family oxidoreductase [Glaciibacter superstes]